MKTTRFLSVHKSKKGKDVWLFNNSQTVPNLNFPKPLFSLVCTAATVCEQSPLLATM